MGQPVPRPPGTLDLMRRGNGGTMEALAQTA